VSGSGDIFGVAWENCEISVWRLPRWNFGKVASWIGSQKIRVALTAGYLPFGGPVVAPSITFHICISPDFQVTFTKLRYVRGFLAVATSMYLNCWPFSRTILFEVTALIQLYPSVYACRTAEHEVCQNSARDYSCSLYIVRQCSFIVQFHLSFTCSLIVSRFGGEKGWCPDGIVLGLNCF